MMVEPVKKVETVCAVSIDIYSDYENFVSNGIVMVLFG